MPFSKTLQKLAVRDRRVDYYEYDESNDAPHWLHLNWPWSVDGAGAATGRTVSECLMELRMSKEDQEG